jgi:hypothetical protein
MTKLQLQQSLGNMDKPELIEVIEMLNSKSKESKSLLSVYFGKSDIKKEFEESKGKIERCFRRNGKPGMFNPKLREAKKFISDFKKVYSASQHKLLELEIAYCYFLAEWLSEYGGGEPSWEDSLCTMFENCCEYVSNNKLDSIYLEELKHINKTLNRNYNELLEEYLSEWFQK